MLIRYLSLATKQLGVNFECEIGSRGNMLYRMWQVNKVGQIRSMNLIYSIQFIPEITECRTLHNGLGASEVYRGIETLYQGMVTTARKNTT